ncbi:hypothetical protein FRB99_004694, partial [Tulasnella sp. 403]
MASPLDLDDALHQIRYQMGSSIPSQKATAVLLNALESTFSQQGTQPTPIAYFGGLITTLDQAIKRGSQPNLEGGAILPAILHLLGVVMPFIPPQ